MTPASTKARDLHQRMEAKARLSTHDAEIKTLEKLLCSPLGTNDRPVLDEIVVTPGYETALGAALGDDLEASLNHRADLYWRKFEEPATSPEKTLPLPDGVIPLKQLVTAPKRFDQTP